MKNLLFIVFLSLCLSITTHGMNRVICPFTGPRATFCDVQLNNLCVNGLISGGVTQGFGNVARVDQVYGNDSTGARNGAPFKTIQAALDAAQAGDTVWVFPGIYNEAVIIPDDVALRGLANNSVTIQQTGVTSATTLVSMGSRSSIQEINLKITAAADVPLKGIVLSGTEFASSFIVLCNILIDTTILGPTTSNVYGISYGAPGNPNGQDICIGSSITILTQSTNVRGVLIDKPDQLLLLACGIAAFGSSAIGVETADANAIVILDGANVSATTADISQTAGDLNLLASALENSTANGLGFDTLVKPATFIFADIDIPLGANQTFWLRPGSSEPSGVPITIPASQKFLAKSLTVHAIVPPGAGESTTVTVQRKKPTDLMPVDTPLSVTLVDSQTEANIQTISVHFDADDLMALKVETSLTAQTGDILASVNTY